MLQKSMGHRASARAIDGLFADLAAVSLPLPDQDIPRLRASSVLPGRLSEQGLVPNQLKNLVEPDGIEPTTSTMPLSKKPNGNKDMT